MLRASHGIAPVAMAKRPKPAKPAEPAASGQDFESMMSRMSGMTAKQKAALRKKLGVAAPPAPKKKKKCELCGSHTHTKSQCTRPGGGRYKPPAPRTAAGGDAA